MKTIKTFEEYRYVNFNNIFNTVAGNPHKDKNEPFFLKKKKPYLAVRDAERREIERVDDLERTRRQREQNEITFEQFKPLIIKYIDILENHQDKILKTAHAKDNHYYGIILRDDNKNIKIIARSPQDMTKCYDLNINNTKIPFYKENIKLNLEMDPLGEEDWNEDERTLTQILGDLVVDYVKDNEIIFY